MNSCGQVWFNELRLSDMDNEGGWAATFAVDSNIADFMNISATARKVLVDLEILNKGLANVIKSILNNMISYQILILVNYFQKIGD